MAKPIPELTAKDIARFWAKVDVRGVNECWPWMGGTDKDGYGRFSIGDATYYRAHRVSKAIAHGISHDFMACHKCDNPPCCNPFHLFSGTGLDNQRDMISKGRKRAARGESVGSSKLSSDDIINIRADDRTQTAIAADYGVSQSLVSGIKHKTRWSHIV
jgi:hypothetical protein